VLVEAMQCGAASVAFACDSGPAAIVRDGVDGLLVPDGDVQALASALARLADDAPLRARLSACAPSVVERFSREAVYRQWRMLCEDVVTQRTRFRSPG